ncbi:antitoxin [Amycolatopsis eburnea]|uniref:Antitoxin n=2 Tax=Amycolatopsis eburnea TaxID=2267691 RepID=A0A427SX23_9PSEU|nr:antitoxin [Amycolatopsis eburnea]
MTAAPRLSSERNEASGNRGKCRKVTPRASIVQSRAHSSPRQPARVAGPRRAALMKAVNRATHLHRPRSKTNPEGAQMGIDFDDVKNVASSGNIDKAAEFAKSRFGEHGDQIDAAAGKAKDFLGRDENQSGNDNPAGDSGGRSEGGYENRSEGGYGGGSEGRSEGDFGGRSEGGYEGGSDGGFGRQEGQGYDGGQSEGYGGQQDGDYGRHATRGYDESSSGDDRGGEQSGGGYDQGYSNDSGEPAGDRDYSEGGYGR